MAARHRDEGLQHVAQVKFDEYPRGTPYPSVGHDRVALQGGEIGDGGASKSPPGVLSLFLLEARTRTAPGSGPSPCRHRRLEKSVRSAEDPCRTTPMVRLSTSSTILDKIKNLQD